MTNQALSQSRDPLTDESSTLSTRGRFILLIILFNLLLLIIVLLSIRNQEILAKTLRVETVNVQIQTRLAIVKSQVTRIVYVTATFTPVPATATPSPSPTPTFTETPIPPTDTPVPPTNTPTPPPTPTETSTPVPTATASPTHTATSPPTATATATATDTPAPTPTSTGTPPPPPPTDTPTSPPPTLLPPTVSSIAPNSGGNESIIAATVGGANFQAGATVLLRRGGYSDILAFNVTVVGATQITGQFDLSGAVPGSWDVVVINPDSQSDTLPGGFTVNPELEHFTFDPIGTQTVGLPFAVTITAHDRYNNPVTDFTGTAALSDSTGTINPVATGSFTAGVWTGNVTINQAQADVTITATSGGRSGVSNAFTVAYPAPTVLSITPNQGENTGTTPVTIAGGDFYATPTARLGVHVLQSVVYIDSTTLTAVVPAGIAAGTYDLYVTNPGPLAPTGVLPGAFTINNADIPSSTLETSFVTTFGTGAPTSEGDNDWVQVMFLEVPDTVTDTLYIRILDPDVGTDGTYDELQGGWDTATTFSLYGGSGVYTDTARQANFATTTDPGISSGTLIVSQTFAVSDTLNGTWYLFATVNPSLGEAVGSKRVFKLSVIGANSGDDGNGYNVALSTSPTSNVQPQGARIFAYSWTFRMPNTNPPRLYPFVSSSTITFTQHNFDFDTQAAITITTPITVYPGSPISGDGTEAFSSFSVAGDEQQVTWAVECINQSIGIGNDVTFWATDQGSQALPIFTRSTTEPAPPP